MATRTAIGGADDLPGVIDIQDHLAIEVVSGAQGSYCTRHSLEPGGSNSAENVTAVRTAIGTMATEPRGMYETLTDC